MDQLFHVKEVRLSQKWSSKKSILPVTTPSANFSKPSTVKAKMSTFIFPAQNYRAVKVGAMTVKDVRITYVPYLFATCLVFDMPKLGPWWRKY